MISTTTTINIEKKRGCSICKSLHHDSSSCEMYFVFGWGSDFITEKEKKLNSERHKELARWCEYARTDFEDASARTLRHIEIMTNDYIIPYSSQNGNPPLLNYLEVYGSPYNAPAEKWFWTNEAWVDHIHALNKRSERHLSDRYGNYYSLTIKNCNSFVDKLNHTIKKSKKCEKDIIHNLDAVSKKHGLPLEICKYIVDYVYMCPYEDGEEILYYEN